MWYQSPLQSNDVKVVISKLVMNHNADAHNLTFGITVQHWTVFISIENTTTPHHPSVDLPRIHLQFGAGTSDYKVILQSHETASAGDSVKDTTFYPLSFSTVRLNNYSSPLG